MTTMAAPSRRADLRAWTLTTVLAAGVVAIGLGLAPHSSLDPHIELPWLLLALAMAAADRYRVHLHVGRETHTFTLAELPTVVGLFLVWPTGVIVARAIGTALALANVHTRRPLKLAFNVASGTFEAAVSVLAFQLLLPVVGPDSSGTYVAALVAMLLGSVVGIVMVWMIIRMVEGARSLRELASSMAAGLPLGVANASIALFVVALLRTRPQLVWISLLPIFVLVITYRAYISQWRHRSALDFLYATAVDTQAQPEADEALLVLVRAARSHLNARAAELVAVGEGATASSGRATVVSVGPGANEEVRVARVEDLPLEVRQRLLAAEAGHDDVGPEEVWATATGTNSGPLLLRVAGPIGNAVTFDGTDLEVLRSLTRLATTAMDRAELAELKAAFLNAVSHELRTPLTVVVGTAATLRARAQQLDPAQQGALLERLEHQAGRLDRLLSDLLDLDRLNRGVIEPRRRLVDLVPLVEHAVDSLDVTDHRVVIGGDTLVAEVDPGLTERIVENLVKNAVKYTPTGTTITIDLDRVGDEVRLVVEDEGAGVPADLRSTLLEPFARQDKHHPQPGTGIGLSLVRRFAQLHGGDARLEEAASGGTRVVVVLRDVVVPDSSEERRLLTT